MKKTNKFAALILALVLTLTLALTGCGKKDAAVIKIAVPNDTTNEARALLLLEEKGIIKLKDGAGITATKNDIVENPYNVEIVEAEAAQLPNVKQDVDYAVINSNYAINAGLNPLKDALAIEGSSSAYGNILCVKEGNENLPKILALNAALESKQVADFITEKYAGSVVSTVTNPTDGYDSSLDYAALNGTTITIAASPTPHAEILEVAKTILAAKGITLISRATMTMLCPTPWSRTAPWMPTTSSTCPIWRTSTPSRTPILCPLPPFTWSPWASTAASRPLWTP